ncbi:PACE efflux transporter [Vibrio sp. SCSIO 43135]|uniref:PACE efflux transporter n=1 Tax=Vibrio sp. SCSIO 43135 TaxID=2819096 RepID=UPI0020761E1C|nr:PACE efflux transporter [Vibrio sp. SCSIO 43135]USD40178.1 PACE efflux transporter [Vibrio sp. SCSIO 43135]
MTTNERVFHAITFEMVALAIIVPVTSLLTGKSGNELLVVGICLSIFTVVWNYVYNIGFDKLFGDNRSDRSLKLRLAHTAGFEGGLIFVTVPAIAWFLNISWLGALAVEAGFLVFFFFYATGFNWVYDKYQPYKRLFGHKRSIAE